MNTVDVLVKAKQLIQDPLNWIQGNYTKMIDGRQCFCSLGAIARAATPDGEPVVWFGESVDTQVARLLLQVVGNAVLEGHTFAAYNDNHTHSEVMEAFDKAIELAKAA